jgi:hypothetical protein
MAVAVLSLAFGWLSPSAASAEELVVIVNGANPTASLTAAQVRAYFLKKKEAWPHGEKLRPVDREGESAERTTFLKEVLGLTSAELKRHWIERQYASGEQPAAEVADEASVVKFVGFFKGGIGFVTRSGLAKAGGQGVKVVLAVEQ